VNNWIAEDGDFGKENEQGDGNKAQQELQNFIPNKEARSRSIKDLSERLRLLILKEDELEENGKTLSLESLMVDKKEERSPESTKNLLYKRMKFKKPSRAPSVENLTKWPSSSDNLDDPFEGIDNLDETEVKVTAASPRVLKQYTPEGDDGFDSKELELLAAVAGFSYVDNKMSEINTVNQAAEQQSEQLNLLLNPHMTRALVEILHAKQLQINSSYARKEINVLDFEKLQNTLESVRQNISKMTSANTIHATKAAARTMYRRKNPFGSFHRSTASISKTFQTLFHVDDLFQNCILDAVDCITDELFHGMLLSEVERQPNLTKYLKSVWRARGLGLSSLNGCLDKIHLLEKMVNDLDNITSYSSVMTKSRKIVAQWKISIEQLLHKLLVSDPIDVPSSFRKCNPTLSHATSKNIWR